ncbi:hypothetical protein SERLA73DRAFT_150311 [Serpula lacrymans var. lacrymans S7.3]|uniref:Uncharacterized protein n=1 Tax=Serpula lacrymans var. lacrymans (strain S7.3) TaxID=936435 RepID=F8PM11_SERL3|nr:hypothetical protein SERLA73DRAFT_150311 [Serpula lacrymans var. lacrymans S7.3]
MTMDNEKYEFPHSKFQGQRLVIAKYLNKCQQSILDVMEKHQCPGFESALKVFFNNSLSNNVDLENDQVDSVKARPSGKNNLLPQFDTVVVMSFPDCEATGIKGTRIGRLRVIFKLPETLYNFHASPNNWPKYHLAYVEWYSNLKSTAEKDHLMYSINKVFLQDKSSLYPVLDSMSDVSIKRLFPQAIIFTLFSPIPEVRVNINLCLNNEKIHIAEISEDGKGRSFPQLQIPLSLTCQQASCCWRMKWNCTLMCFKRVWYTLFEYPSQPYCFFARIASVLERATIDCFLALQEIVLPLYVKMYQLIDLLWGCDAQSLSKNPIRPLFSPPKLPNGLWQGYVRIVIPLIQQMIYLALYRVPDTSAFQ